MGLGVVAVVVVWLVFSVLRKVVGLSLLAALALCAWLLWSDPEVLRSVLRMLP
jgi:hypothetical protein